MDDLRAENLNGIYRDIAEQLGVEIAELIHSHYQGMQITFPKRLLCKEYVRECIQEACISGQNARELARRFGYSERWVRHLLTDNHSDKS